MTGLSLRERARLTTAQPVCVVCEQAFTRRNRQQLVCSPECRKRWKAAGHKRHRADEVRTPPTIRPGKPHPFPVLYVDAECARVNLAGLRGIGLQRGSLVEVGASKSGAVRIQPVSDSTKQPIRISGQGNIARLGVFLRHYGFAPGYYSGEIRDGAIYFQLAKRTSDDAPAGWVGPRHRALRTGA